MDVKFVINQLKLKGELLDKWQESLDMFTAVDNHTGNTPNGSRTIERQEMLNHLFTDVI